MKLRNTNIPDIDMESIDKEKEILGNKIYKKIGPLFHSRNDSLQSDLHEKKTTLRSINNSIINTKEELKLLHNELVIKKEIHQILKIINNICSIGFSTNTGFRHEIIILLRSIDTFTIDQLKSNKKRLMQMLNKRLQIK